MFGAESVDPWSTLASFGAAAPVIGGLVWYALRVTKERDRLVERLLSTTEQIIPLASELKDLARRLADDRPAHREP